MNVRHALKSIPWSVVRWAVVILVLAVGWGTFGRWWPTLTTWVQSTTSQYRAASGTADAHGGHSHGGEAAHADHAGDEHAGHDHAGHSAENAVEVSPQALKNLGLTGDFLRPVSKSTFRRSIRVPAIVVEKPGRTRVQVSTPMTAVITQIHIGSGEAVNPGQLLFTLRLTHEDLVSAQTEFLKTLGEIDVENQEVARLEKIPEGAVPAKLLLERQYALQRLKTALSAGRESLKLHGLTEEHVKSIETERKLLRTLQVFAPAPGKPTEKEFRLTESELESVSFFAPAETTPEPTEGLILVVENLGVHQGQTVVVGEVLCTLADYSSLYIEGQAFEKDAVAITHAHERGWPISAEFDGGTSQARLDGLRMAFISNEIDVASRTLHFYVDLPNTRLPAAPGATTEDNRFVTWRYRPGQRLELEVPVEEWADQIVLPVDAVAREGAESYVFLQNGKHFDRKPVHVKYRDQSSVVVANDGTLFPGDVVARRGAHQLLMALKNKSGGGVDPHAGHSHD